MPTSSSRDIYARWGYSEISSPYSADQYARAPKIEHLREARAAGVPFAEIVEADRAHLAYICGLVRTPLTRFTIGIENFEEIALARATLADLKVPRSISRLPRMSFAAFMVTNSRDPADCRNMVANGEYVSPPDPLTVGRGEGELVLIDGYHRAALFWKFAEPTRSIQVYVPAD